MARRHRTASSGRSCCRRSCARGWRTFVANGSASDLDALERAIEAGKVTPVIDRTYPLAEAPDAIRYLQEGHARGKIVITI